MHSKTGYNHYKRLLSIAKNTYMKAEIYCLDSERVSDLLSEGVYNDPAYAKINSYWRGCLSGAIDTMHSAHIRFFLEQRVMYHGNLIKSEDVPSGEWINVTPHMGNLVYTKHNDRVWYTDNQLEQWAKDYEERITRLKETA